VSDGLLLRSATPADGQMVAALLESSALPLAGVDEQLRGFVLAERDGALVGCAAVEVYETTGLLRSVAVRESERGRSTGQALVNRCIADARSAQLESLVLLTTTADRYFPRFGFRVIERAAAPAAVRESVEFREACPASAAVMQLSLTVPVIRAAHAGDADAVAAIYNAGIRSRGATFETRERTSEEVAAWFSDDRHPVLVAESDSEVVGWIAASSYRPRDCYAGIAEFAVYVKPEQQRRGIGDALMAAFLPALEANGHWKTLSRIFPENTASLALCRRHGFREVGRYQRHARLDGEWRDVIIVERLLGAASSSRA
jgi:L-amino acid N-acyltransferase YncA